jgi:hypothetical protein
MHTDGKEEEFYYQYLCPSVPHLWLNLFLIFLRVLRGSLRFDPSQGDSPRRFP